MSFYKLKPLSYKPASGFTLIELMVAVSIFVMVALIVTGALYTIVQAWLESQTVKLLTDNLNFSMDSMVIKMREGSDYHTYSTVSGNVTSIKFKLKRPGANAVTVVGYGVGPGTHNQQTLLKCQVDNLSDSATAVNDNCNNDGDYQQIIADDITVNSARFLLNTVNTRPAIMVLFDGQATTKNGHIVTFRIQTLVSQNPQAS